MNIIQKLTRLVLISSTLATGLPLLKANIYSVHLAGSTVGLSIDGTVDTSTDSFTITSWTSNPLALPWTPAGGALPLTLQAFTLAGFGPSVGYDVADNWNGTMSGWGFMLPVSVGVGDIAWQQGTPLLASSSFGWGGFRGTNGYTGDLGGIGAGTFQYVPYANGAIDINLDTVQVQAAPDAGATIGLLAFSLAGLVAARRKFFRN